MQYHHLPHIDIEGYYQFVTFRTNDSSDGFLKKLAKQSTANNKKQLAADNYLDKSKQGAYLNNSILIFLSEFIKDQDGILYELIAFSIMPNHVHLLFRPLEQLAVVMQKLKGFSAKKINEILGEKGRFWASDYYDKAIRDEKHFKLVYDYIKNNPLKLDEVNSSRFYGIYEYNETEILGGAKAPLPSK